MLNQIELIANQLIFENKINLMTTITAPFGQTL